MRRLTSARWADNPPPPRAVVTEPARAFFREAGCGAAVICLHSSANLLGAVAAVDGSPGRLLSYARDRPVGSGKTPMWPGHRPANPR